MHKFDNSTFLEGIDAFHQKELYVKVSIHIEVYGNGKLEMGFVTFSLINQNFTFDNKGDDSEIDIFEEQNMILAE